MTRTLADYRPQHDDDCSIMRCARCDKNREWGAPDCCRCQFGEPSFASVPKAPGTAKCTCGLSALLASASQETAKEEQKDTRSDQPQPAGEPLTHATATERRPDPQFFDAKGEYLDGPHYGKDCPVGKVQVEFVGVSSSLRFSPHGWKPSDHAFLDIWVDGERYNIQVGSFESSRGPRRGLHIVTGIKMKVDAHSINAVDVYSDGNPPTTAERAETPQSEAQASSPLTCPDLTPEAIQALLKEADESANLMEYGCQDDRDVAGLFKQLAAALRHLSPLHSTREAETGWQPIETAPKDGTGILLYKCGYGMMRGHWNAGGAMHMPHWSTPANMFDPTHWMPAPQSPTEPSQGAPK